MELEKKDGPLVQLVITRTKSGEIRLVEFSPKEVIDVKQFTQPEVAMLILRKLLNELTAVGSLDV